MGLGILLGLELKLGYMVLQEIDCGTVLPSENLFYNRTGEADLGLKGNPTFAISSFGRKAEITISERMSNVKFVNRL